MKKLFTILVPMAIGILLTASVFAQSPEKMSYQAVIRDASDNLVTNQTVGMQISILQGSASGPAVYVETQTPITNANGLVSIEIGGGAGFNTIDWANDIYFIKTETDPAGGSTYTITSTSQLLSVPYAFHAKTAETVSGGITETDPAFTAWDKSTGISITESQISNLDHFTTADETDPLFGASVANGITGADTTNWNNKLDNETDPTVPAGTAEGEMQYWDGSEWVTVAAGTTGQKLSNINGVPTWIDNDAMVDPVLGQIWSDVTSTTGAIWMDRNLGASQVATSSTDANAYGDLYQWGRGTDGHEKRTSGTSSTLSSSDDPGHGDFIIVNSGNFDWRSPQNDNLWQGVSGTNNPCPSGYRLPTEAEWEAERASWSSNDSAGAFASTLKLPVAGLHGGSDGLPLGVGISGNFWSSTVFGTASRCLSVSSSNAGMYAYVRARGGSVRCFKD